MEQVLEFAGNHPLLTGGFALVLVILAFTEITRLTRKFREVDTRQAIRMINSDTVTIIDVSPNADFARGHIIGAINMPPSRIEAGNTQLARLADKPVLVYCKNGQISPQMAGRLVKNGFTDVAILKGGLAQWRADGQPVTRQPAGRKAD